MSVIVGVILGPWCCVALAAAVILPVCGVVAAGELASRIRRGKESQP